MARQNHPDAKGDASAVRMAQINEAWRVLSDPARRAVYDARTSGFVTGPSSASPSNGRATTAQAHRPPPTPVPVATPARFPWRFMLVLAGLGIAFILVNAALSKPGTPDRPDNLIDSGSCVNFADNGDAIEVPCDGSNRGVVVGFRGSDPFCPQGTEEHRDHQGMGPVCVRLATTGG